MREAGPFARSFFAGLIDYAGLFPPAKLSLGVAVKNYREYLDREDSWILSRFILTSGHLQELRADNLNLFSSDKPLDVSLISRDLPEDLPLAAQKVKEQSGRLAIGSVEAPLDLEKGFSQQISSNEEALMTLGPTVSVFYEIPLHDEWDETLATVVAELATVGQSSPRLVGFKLRCGGIEDNLVPSPERVTKAIAACAQHKVPMKFTAGLHHPFRHKPGKDSGLSVPMHGYFNIFFAAFLANLRKMSPDELVSVISEMEDVSLVLDKDGVKWLGYEVSFREIANLRTGSAISYGSCSFLEPIEDARKQGWL